MSPYLTLLILFAVSALLLALCFFCPRWSKTGTYICLGWLAMALPLMYFIGLTREEILLFYLLSGAAGLVYMTGGEKK